MCGDEEGWKQQPDLPLTGMLGGGGEWGGMEGVWWVLPGNTNQVICSQIEIEMHCVCGWAMGFWVSDI
jgi:hypothetical protein